jgi:hypothetical protein
VRLLAYTDSRETGGAELALGFLIGALGPEFDVGLLGVDRAVLEAIATRDDPRILRFTASAMARGYEAVYRRMVAVPG